MLQIIYMQITSFIDALSFQLSCFNIAKCKHLKYCTNASPYEYCIIDEGFIFKLSAVSSEKDLGVWITFMPDFTLLCDC